MHDLPLLPAPRWGELHPGAHLPAAPGADRPWRASHQPLPGLDGGHDPSAGLGAGSGMTAAASRRPPLTPKEGWLIHGRQVLRFRPTRWERTYQRLEITTGELLPDQEIPLLKSRRELSRAEALKLWAEKRKAGWCPCSLQW